MKARLPEEFNRRGANNLQQLARQAEKMKQDMEAATEELEKKEYEASAGGGAVEVVVKGNFELCSVKISEEAFDKDDLEILSDMIIGAANEAIRAAKKEKEEVMDKLSAGMNLPGVF